ncbi:MAG: NAD(P)/FAD-dependent oxidoreductase [Leptolyngbyaceae cyanobacterium]
MVIGAGFGGLQAAQSLRNSGAEVVLIERRDYHTFIPLLYQVAAAQISADTVAYPVRTLLRRNHKLRFICAEVQRIDFDQRLVDIGDAAISYDYLVLATGSQTQYLGVNGAPAHSFTLRTLEQAIALRNHLLRCFEQAERETDRQIRQQLLTLVIVGGGATGVEIAGSLVELQRALKRDYCGIDLGELQIVLVQAGPRLLPDLPERLGHYAAHKLRRLGVKIHLQTRVRRVTPTAVEWQDGSTFGTGTVIWAAGLEAALPRVVAPPPTGNRQKLKVQPTLQLQNQTRVYGIGDVAEARHKGQPLTGVAPEALQQGVAVARNIRRQLRGKSPQPFRYFNKGRLAIIGCRAGVGKIGPILLTGFLPWLMWLGVHLVYLPGWRNRLVVLLTWLHGYGLGDRPIRFILPSSRSAPRQIEPIHTSTPASPEPQSQ